MEYLSLPCLMCRDGCRSHNKSTDSAAVTLTGSEAVGRQVAATAGRPSQRCVPGTGWLGRVHYCLADADLEMAATQAVIGRYQNCGQSCIAAKRFIVVPQIADDFIAPYSKPGSALKIGEPRAKTRNWGRWRARTGSMTCASAGFYRRPGRSRYWAASRSEEKGPTTSLPFWTT
jgi:hypothetical protein